MQLDSERISGRRVVWAALTGAVTGLLAIPLWFLIVGVLDPDSTMPITRDLSADSEGLYPREGMFFWTRPHSVLRLNGISRERPWNCVFVVSTYCPDPALLPEVVFAVDGTETARIRVTNADQVVRIPVRADPSREGASFQIDCSTVFVPGPPDPRELGIVIRSITVHPEGSGLRFPVNRLLYPAIFGACAMGAALGFILGAVPWAIVAAALQALGMVMLLHHGTTFEVGYGVTVLRFSLWLAVAGVVAALVWMRLLKGKVDSADRAVLVVAVAVTCLNLLVLLHPQKPVMDDVMHVHRLQYLLRGRYFFTAIPEGGFEYPQAIGLYLLAAPFTLMTPDCLSLLHIILVVSVAAAGLMLYVAIRRQWNDATVAVLAVVGIQVFPVVFDALGRASMANLFAINVSILAVSVLVSIGRDGWSPSRLIVATLLIVLALISHFIVLMVFVPTLVIIAVFYIVCGQQETKRRGREVLVVTAVAAAISFGLYYRAFMPLYVKQFVRVADVVRGVTPRDWRANESYAPRQLPEQTPYAPGGASIGLRLQSVPRYVSICIGWPLVVLCAIGIWRLLARRADERLTLAIVGWFLASVLVVALGILTPMNMRPYLVFAPAGAVLAAAGAAWMWRAGRPWQVVLIGLAGWSLWNALQSRAVWLV